ncbi:hypothetical protein [Streptomyces fulvorobeus]|uniref:Uncharacterized protein n=1 Tax=Streptomyces fulvorobeus TaxID=284028 RepID=A0A7J0C796_9ACTN|nr:hypothetical protein [Streptomyces fulvorobeus]NYE42006.1 hypothetical protein [Streptomyces fulvorobeus]GFM98380.1 hypothetical protein Sfulv_31910 [Streptomyces fulvorobeus]
MRTYIGGHQVVSDTDFVELALGTPLDLWLGVEGESEMERAARLDAARDILADNPDLPDRVSQAAAEAIEAHAPNLFNVVLLPTRRAAGRRQYRGGAAA